MINSANFTHKDQPYKTVFFETFGCQMNKLDAELSLGLLQEDGYKIVDKVDDADKYQKLTVAKGEAEAIQTVFGAIHEGKPTNDLIAIKYLESLEKIADGKATKVFLPYEATGILGSIAGISELLKEKPSSQKEEQK